MVLVDLANAIPIAGVCLANAKALTPLASILKVRAEAQLGSLNPLPLVAVTGNNAGWVAYSAFGTHDMYIFASAAIPTFPLSTAFSSKSPSKLISVACC